MIRIAFLFKQFICINISIVRCRFVYCIVGQILTEWKVEKKRETEKKNSNKERKTASTQHMKIVTTLRGILVFAFGTYRKKCLLVLGRCRVCQQCFVRRDSGWRWHRLARWSWEIVMLLPYITIAAMIAFSWWHGMVWQQLRHSTATNNDD